MKLGKSWEKIQKDLIHEENKDKVYMLLEDIQGDTLYLDENGKRVLTDEEELVIRELIDLGEDKIAKRWV